MVAVKNISKNFIIFLLCFAIACAPFLLPAQVHAVFVETAALATALGLSSAGVGALLLTLNQGVSFSGTGVISRFAEFIENSVTNPVFQGLSSVANEAAAQTGSSFGTNWINVGNFSLTAVTAGLQAAIGSWNQVSTTNSVFANLVDYYNQFEEHDIVPIPAADFVDYAGLVMAPGSWASRYSSVGYASLNYQTYLNYFNNSSGLPVQIGALNFNNCSALGMSNVVLKLFLFDNNAYYHYSSSGVFVPYADRNSEGLYIDPDLSVGISLSWTDGAGTHCVIPYSMSFPSSRVPTWPYQENSTYILISDVGASFNLVSLGITAAQFFADPFGALGFTDHTILWPNTYSDHVELAPANPKDGAFGYVLATAVNGNYPTLMLGAVLSAILLPFFESAPTIPISAPGTEFYSDQYADFGGAQALPSSGYVAVPNTIGNMTLEEFLNWFNTVVAGNPAYNPTADVPDVDDGQLYTDAGVVINGNPDANAPSIPDVFDGMPVAGNPSVDIPGVDVGPIVGPLTGIREVLENIGEGIREIIQSITGIGEGVIDPDVDPDVDLTDGIDPIVDLFESHDQFEGVFNHFLPPEVAAMFWTFTLVGIFVFIIRFLIDR